MIHNPKAFPRREKPIATAFDIFGDLCRFPFIKIGAPHASGSLGFNQHYMRWHRIMD